MQRNILGYYAAKRRYILGYFVASTASARARARVRARCDDISLLRYLERHNNILGYFAAATIYPSVKLSCDTGNVLYGMAPYFGHTAVTFDVENDRPGPESLRGHFEAA